MQVEGCYVGGWQAGRANNGGSCAVSPQLLSIRSVRLSALCTLQCAGHFCWAMPVLHARVGGLPGTRLTNPSERQIRSTQPAAVPQRPTPQDIAGRSATLLVSWFLVRSDIQAAKQWDRVRRGSMPRNRDGTPEATPPVLVRGLTWQRMSSSGSRALSPTAINNGEEASPQGPCQLSGICGRVHSLVECLLAQESHRVSQSESTEWTEVGAQRTILCSCTARQAERCRSCRAQGRTSNRQALAPPRARRLRRPHGAGGRSTAPMTTVCSPDTPCHRPVPPGDPATDTTDTLGYGYIAARPDTAFCSSHQTGSALTAHPLACNRLPAYAAIVTSRRKRSPPNRIKSRHRRRRNIGPGRSNGNDSDPAFGPSDVWKQLFLFRPTGYTRSRRGSVL